ncbi:HU family DNA-binding protein [Acinetobacter pittii]|uniref:HU family DNA-binding protein n=1 Tax=Acinetobacter pittii TaxID=48296 RepID=UPI0025B24757|nr:HU family DNA-binding protein [Acinetobacter pittii]
MNKSELIKHIASTVSLTQAQATAALQAVESAVSKALASGEDVALIGFGTFSVKERAARIGRNPKTGEELQIAASKVPSFKAGKALKEAVNG